MINFKIPVNRHLFAGQLKTECLNEHLRHLPRCDRIIIKQERKKEKRFPLAWEVGHTNASNRCDFARPRVHLKPDSSQSSHWGQSTALEAHTQRAFTVHACPAIHRDTNYNEQIWSGVGSCPSKLAHHTKKTHAHFKLKRTLAASHAGRARWRHVLRVKCNANDKLGATPTDFTAHRTRTCEPSHDALANKAHLSA